MAQTKFIFITGGVVSSIGKGLTSACIGALLKAKNIKVTAKDTVFQINGPVDFAKAVQTAGKKGISINRYKGLGEMNPEQLWETTLDPNSRNLLQVKINQFSDAEGVFATLMGDVVEPRRDFIQENALNVVNLDV